VTRRARERGKSARRQKNFSALQFNAPSAAKPRTSSVKHLTACESLAATCNSCPAASVRGPRAEKSGCKTLAFAKSRA
jgi:hypothetical protein